MKKVENGIEVMDPALTGCNGRSGCEHDDYGDSCDIRFNCFGGFRETYFSGSVCYGKADAPFCGI